MFLRWKGNFILPGADYLLPASNNYFRAMSLSKLMQSDTKCADAIFQPSVRRKKSGKDNINGRVCKNGAVSELAVRNERAQLLVRLITVIIDDQCV